MKRKTILITIIILLSLTTTYIYSNDKVYFEIKCKNIEKDMCEKVRAIFISEFKRHNYNISESKKDCVYIFLAEANLNKDYLVIELQKQDKGGKVIFSDKKFIDNFNDLEVSISLLIKSVISEKKMELPKRKKIETSFTEDDEHNEQYLHKRILFSLDFYGLNAFGENKLRSKLNLGFKLIFLYKFLRIDAIAHSFYSASRGLYGLKTHYIFFENRITPYIGSGLIIGELVFSSRVKKNKELKKNKEFINRGFFIPLIVGLQLLDDSSTEQLLLELGIYLPFQKLRTNDEITGQRIKIDSYNYPIYLSLSFAFTLVNEKDCCGCGWCSW